MKMTNLNLTNQTEDDLKALQEYILKGNIGDMFLEHFIEISIKDDFELNSNNEHLLEYFQLFILNSIIKSNLNIFLNLHQTTPGDQINLIILTSIKNELITRTMKNLETTLTKKTPKIDIRSKL
jgi:hypothetical protein